MPPPLSIGPESDESKQGVHTCLSVMTMVMTGLRSVWASALRRIKGCTTFLLRAVPRRERPMNQAFENCCSISLIVSSPSRLLVSSPAWLRNRSDIPSGVRREAILARRIRVPLSVFLCFLMDKLSSRTCVRIFFYSVEGDGSTSHHTESQNHTRQA